MNTTGSVHIGVVAGAAVLVAAAGYFVASERVYVPVLSPMIANTETDAPTDTTSNDQTPSSPKIQQPESQTFSAEVKDVKYFYDTVRVPEEGHVRSGYKNVVAIRGKLIAIKPEVLCQSTPCPQPDSSQYRYVIENAQDYIQNSKYRISIRNTGDSVARSLKEGQVYVFRGILEHGFNDAGKVNFVFDPSSAE